MENNQAMVPKFSVKSAGFLFSMGLLCGVLLPSVLLWTVSYTHLTLPPTILV